MKMSRLRRRWGERTRKVQDMRCWARIGLGADLEKCTDWMCELRGCLLAGRRLHMGAWGALN